MLQGRCRAGMIAIVLVLLLQFAMPCSAPAQDVALNQEIDRQVELVVSALRDSEADSAAGAYVPGIGATFIIELLRGPNTSNEFRPYRGVRDWTIYLMQQFGGSLTALPAGETVSFAVHYYDFIDHLFHTLTISSPIETIDDANAYSIWLDGGFYNEADARAAEIAGGGDPSAEPTSSTILIFETTPTAVPTMLPTIAPTPAVVATPLPAATPVVSDAPITFESATSLADWQPVGGTWTWQDNAYHQTELNRFDLISYYRAPLTAPYRISISFQFIEGQMGGGLVFGAPDITSKNNAQMVSFAADGEFLQWGWFDPTGVFQYQGGANVTPPVNDSEWHTLVVEVANGVYTVLLDELPLGAGIPLGVGNGDGYAGLLASTAHIAFDSVTIEALPE